jgi:hypothetical protein
MLPDSIPESVWSEFRAHRKKLKKPMTDYAETLIICKLEKWRVENGANPIDVLNESIEKGWCGVFLNGHGANKIAGTNQHGRMGRDALPGFNESPSPTLCASCGKPLTSGFKHSSRGRLCHEC